MAEGGDQLSSFIVVDVDGDLKDVENEDLVKKFAMSYLEDIGRSGGGRFASGGFVKNPESQKLQYVAHYANLKSVERVLKRHEHCIEVDKKTLVLTVRPCPPYLKKVLEKETHSSNGEDDVVTVSPMAKTRQSLVQDKIGDLTKCSICTEIFTNPKILPCVHTFCLHCLETYGKDKQPGDQITCPICRNEFAIPDGGLCNLPNNFFIGEMVEIGKLSTSLANEAMCNICPEGEEIIAKMYCINCEQILCERCSKFHKKIKSSQNHQVVELGSKLSAQNFNLRNSYCDHHPKELIKMYCYNDNVAICLICCVESHQSHRCVNVDNAAGEFAKRLKEDLRKVTIRLPECEKVGENLDKYKKEFLREISKSEESIRDTGTKLKELIDQHTEILVQNLKSVMEQNLKAFEITKQDVERFRVMIDSYAKYCEDLLSRGSPVNICRAADQMHTRANEFEKLPANCNGDCFRCDTVAFHPSNFENLLKQCRSTNVVGDLTVTESPDRIINFEIESTVATSFLEKDMVEFKGQRMLVTKHEGQAAEAGRHEESDSASAAALSSQEYGVSGSFSTVKVSGLPQDTSKDMISMYFENNKRSGGGRLTVLELQKEKGKAVIKFDNPKDGLEVCKRTQVLFGVTLKIVALEMPLDDVKSCAIEVKGLDKGTNENFLEMHFENTRRSGGGAVEKLFLNKEAGSAIVVFEEATAVLGVMKKQPQVLGRTVLEVNVLEAAPPPPLLLNDVDTKRLLAKRLPHSTTKESLREYLAPAAKAKMVGWTQAVKLSTALLEFSSEPDYLSIRRLVCSKPFLGKMISIRRVPLTSSILVTGMPSSIGADFLAMYFENPLSGSKADECKIQMLHDKGSAIVEFERPDVIPTITSRRHQFLTKEVKVEPYYPWLG